MRRLTARRAQFGAAKGFGNGFLQGAIFANLKNGLERSREVLAIVTQHRSLYSDLGLPQGRLKVGAEVMVEAPA